MKKFASMLALVIALPSIAAAQAQTITVNASIAQYNTTVLTNGTLNLGSAIVQGAAGTVAASGASAAQVTVSFNTASLSFSLPAVVTLTRSGGSETMSAALTCATAATANAGTTSACGAAVSNVYTQSVTYNGTHQSALASQTLYVGGTVTAGTTANARAGTYSGTISVTITNVTT